MAEEQPAATRTVNAVLFCKLLLASADEAVRVARVPLATRPSQQTVPDELRLGVRELRLDKPKLLAQPLLPRRLALRTRSIWLLNTPTQATATHAYKHCTRPIQTTAATPIQSTASPPHKTLLAPHTSHCSEC